MPKVSVIIPCYNQGQYIDEAVDSVLNQTYKEFEVIIVNDGSTDEFTMQKLQNYSKPKTRVIHTLNEGLSAARNNGIKKAKGEYILPLDADDKIGHTFLELTIPYLDDSNIVAVGTGITYFGEVTGTTKLSGGSLKNFLHYNRTVATTLFRKSSAESVGLYDENMKLGYEDWEFWIRLLSKGGEIKILDKPLFYYRKRKNSMLSQTEQNHIECYEYILKKHTETYRKYIIELVIKKETLLQNAILDKRDLQQKINELQTYIYNIRSHFIIKRLFEFRSFLKKLGVNV